VESLRQEKEKAFDDAMTECDLESSKLREINESIRKELRAKE
jgi:hypothetical protein